MRGFMGLVLAGLLAPLAMAAAPPVTAAKPWIRYLLPSVPAGGYLTLQNNGGTPMVLTGAASPACGMLMLHQTQTMSGMSMMMDVPSLTIPAHGSVVFAPGGYHLMCMSPVMKVGTTVQITLKFADGSSLPITMPVYGATGAP